MTLRKVALMGVGLLIMLFLFIRFMDIENQCFHRVCPVCQDIVNTSTIRQDPTFYFVPENITNCHHLFQTHRGRGFQYPESYINAKAAFSDYMQKNLPEGTFLEGHTGRFQEQLAAYYTLVNSPGIKTVCETGFNAGHSTFQWLAGNPEVRVYSFDLGWHEYSKTMAGYLQREFPNRLTLTWGDSTQTLPEMKRAHPDLVCDLLIVDGGHSFQVARADLENMEKFANPDNNILVLDDHPGLKGPEDIWAQLRKEGRVQEIFRCCYFFPNFQGFTVARYRTKGRDTPPRN